MQELIDVFQANSALALANHIASSPSRTGTARDRGLSPSILMQTMWTAADGDSRSRIPSCGRRYADAPTAVPFTAQRRGRISSVLRATIVRCCGRAQDCGLYAFFLTAPTVPARRVVWNDE